MNMRRRFIIMALVVIGYVYIAVLLLGWVQFLVTLAIGIPGLIIWDHLNEIVKGVILSFFGSWGLFLDALHDRPFFWALIDGAIAMRGFYLVHKWWNDRGKKKFAEKLAGYKARAIQRKMQVKLGKV